MSNTHQKIKHIDKITVLESLLRGDRDITALNGFKFSTTRVSNTIVKLRKNIEITTKMVKSKYSRFGIYLLVRTPQNIAKAKQMLLNYKLKAQLDTNVSLLDEITRDIQESIRA